MIAQKYVVGKLLVRKFRNYLEGLKFMGYTFEYQESRDWFEHHFFVKGDMEAIIRINSSLERAATEHIFS